VTESEGGRGFSLPSVIVSMKAMKDADQIKRRQRTHASLHFFINLIAYSAPCRLRRRLYLFEINLWSFLKSDEWARATSRGQVFLEGCLAKSIPDRLQLIYGDASYALSSVFFWIMEFKGEWEEIVDQPCSGPPLINNLDADLLGVLWHSPFGTVRLIIEEVGISPETMHRRLTESW
jgi:hypothetical protein